MKAVLSGGGTAGHINPALALAEELSERGFTCLFVGTPTGVEAKLVTQAGLPFMPIEVYGFDRSKPLSLIKALAAAEKGTRIAKKWLAEEKPDVVVGFGGYVSIPVARAACALRIPLVIHEQNSVMGMANKYASKKACSVCLTYDNADVNTDDARVSVTGNPVRRDVQRGTREEGRAYLGIPEDATMLLVFGGSLGARHINEAITALKDELLSRENLYIVHIAGPHEFDRTREALSLTDDEKARYLLKGYEDQMPLVLAAADAIVSRAGATSLAEIAVRGIPAILVPYPYATADHQRTNAQSYVESGGAFLILDDEVEGEEFAQTLFRLIDEPELRARMHRAAGKLEANRAAERLADIVVAAVDAS